MVNDQAIGAVGAVSRRYQTPVERITGDYNRFNHATRPEGATLEGFKFINPYMGDGYNLITMNLDPLADGNGGLNCHAKYNAEGEVAMHTMMWMG